MATPSPHTEEAGAAGYDLALTRRLLAYLRPHRLAVVGAILLLLTGAALELVGPYVTKLALDRAIPNRDEGLLLTLVLAFVAALVLAFAAEYGQRLLTTWLAQRVMHDIRVQIFSHLQRLSLRYFDRNPVGRLMTRVTNDVEVLNETFSSGVVSIFGDVFTLLFIVAAMFLLNWKLAAVTLLVLPVMLWAAFLFRGRIRRAYQDIRLRIARINAYLQERIGGVRIVQLFGREPETQRRFEEINRDHLEAHLRSITYYALFFPVVEVLTAIALALILWYGGSEAMRGALTVGTLAAFLQYARRFFRPIQDLSEKYNILQGAMASSERIFELLDTEPEILDDPEPLPLPRPAEGRIEFREVWFRYSPGDEWVLRGVSFVAAPGERVAIVGATGAGKSTIISLLMRFYAPDRGEILFDGVPISRVASDDLRARIGLVLQDVFLFSGTVRENLRLGRSGISGETLEAAARRVGAERFILRLPAGFDQPVGERGITLSAGERQLVSFARALAGDPAVLVLDEATSAIDTELEAQIQAALEQLMRGRTSLVIAHRLSTVRGARQILVLHRGEIRERGSHADLIQLGGLYARLHELQFVDPEIAGGRKDA